MARGGGFVVVHSCVVNACASLATTGSIRFDGEYQYATSVHQERSYASRGCMTRCVGIQLRDGDGANLYSGSFLSVCADHYISFASEDHVGVLLLGTTSTPAQAESFSSARFFFWRYIRKHTTREVRLSG